jgi:hypothetical protein
MRHAILIVSMALLTGAIPLSADQQPVVRSAKAQLGALRRAEQSNAYRKLFEVRDALHQATEQAAKTATPAPKKKIVCGMTVIEVGPALDPKMALEPKKDPGVTYTIRAIDPPVCNASAAR